jgi:hypothetical protein
MLRIRAIKNALIRHIFVPRRSNFSFVPADGPM